MSKCLRQKLAGSCGHRAVSRGVAVGSVARCPVKIAISRAKSNPNSKKICKNIAVMVINILMGTSCPSFELEARQEHILEEINHLRF